MDFMDSKPVEVEVDKVKPADGKMNINDSNVEPKHLSRMEIDDEVGKLRLIIKII